MNSPSKLTEGSGCTCASEKEHEILVRTVDESFKKDVQRAKERTERNTHALRAKVLAQLNGKG